MKNKYLPLLIGFISLIIVLLMPIKNRFFTIMGILILIPLITYKRRDKDSGKLPYLFGLQGGIIGGFSGIIIDYIIMNMIYSDMARYSIRFDLFLGGILGTSIGATLGIIAGERKSKRDRESN